MIFCKPDFVQYTPSDLKMDWTNISNPSKDMIELAENNMPEEEPQEGEQEEAPKETTPDVILGIYVRTKPAELIQSDGDAEYKPIAETTLLYMSNTDSDILMDIRTQDYYVLIAGRWYESSELTGNKWTFINPAELPEEFQKIPSDSEIASIKASVATTEEAKASVLENQIPQTAEINRNDATPEVTHDGDPQYDYTAGTSMKYAVNTNKSVLFINNKYYYCENATWFVSSKPSGPGKYAWKFRPRFRIYHPKV